MQERGVAVGIEPVAFCDRDFVGPRHILAPANAQASMKRVERGKWKFVHRRSAVLKG